MKKTVDAPSLGELRKEIDQIDEDVHALLMKRGNIIVDFFTQAAGERVNGALDRFGALLLALMLGLLAWRTAAGALAVDEAGEQTMILGLPMWWTYAVLAPGLGLTAVIAVAQAFKR